MLFFRQVEACHLPKPMLASLFGLFVTGSGDGSLRTGGYKHGRIRCANRDASVRCSFVADIRARAVMKIGINRGLSGFHAAR